MSKETAREAARILLQTKSIHFNIREPFVYTSGKRGPVYVDCRRLISFPEERTRLMDMAAGIIRSACPDTAYIAGGETAGIPYAALIADRLNLPMLYVRKKAKGFGRMSQIEGHMNELDRKALVVEDVQNYGTSVQIFVDALRSAGAIVQDVFVIFQHGHEASRRNMKALNVTLHSLTDWNAVLTVAREDEALDSDTLASIEAFLENPEAWRPSAGDLP
jgi:orotate phosphoribosyltransferase